MNLFDQIQASGYYTRHNRASSCTMFHENMPYSDDRERVPLVMDGVHRAVDSLLMEEVGIKRCGFLRKRLAFNPVALEVYYDHDRLVASYFPEEWSKELRQAIENEVTHWLAEDHIRRG